MTMKKKFTTDTSVVSELAQGSAFFRPRPAEEHELPVEGAEVTELPLRHTASTSDSTDDSNRASSHASNNDSTQDIAVEDEASDSERASTQASKQARTIARERVSPRAGKQAESLASMLADSADLVDAIYRIVKRPGKEVSYVRLTEREKSELTTILAGLGQDHGYKVTETELIRIAICNLLADYAQNGTESLLMKVIVDLKD